jgi:hypothetical protein
MPMVNGHQCSSGSLKIGMLIDRRNFPAKLFLVKKYEYIVFNKGFLRKVFRLNETCIVLFGQYQVAIKDQVQLIKLQNPPIIDCKWAVG